MALEVKSSINIFISELEQRISLYSSNKVTENVDNANIDEINIILSKYDIASESNIRVDEVRKIKLDDIKKILFLIGQNEDSIAYIVTKIDEHYEKICNLLNNYINDFINIEKNQNDMINDKINLYKKYIELFQGEEFTEPFDELNELSKVMSEVGLSDEDKWKLMSYVGKANISTINSIDPKLSVRVSTCIASIKDHLENKEIMALLENKLSTSEIHIDTIPTIAAELASECGLDLDITTNMLATLIAKSLLTKLYKTENRIIQVELIDIINSVLEYVTKIEDQEIYLAKDIRNKTYELYYNSVNSGINEEMIKVYLETPITNLMESENITREHAVELKQLSVLKPIYDTLDTIEKLDKDTEEYKKALVILKKLVEQYYVLENKKNELESKHN